MLLFKECNNINAPVIRHSSNYCKMEIMTNIPFDEGSLLIICRYGDLRNRQACGKSIWHKTLHLRCQADWKPSWPWVSRGMLPDWKCISVLAKIGMENWNRRISILGGEDDENMAGGSGSLVISCANDQNFRAAKLTWADFKCQITTLFTAWGRNNFKSNESYSRLSPA